MYINHKFNLEILEIDNYVVNVYVINVLDVLNNVFEIQAYVVIIHYVATRFKLILLLYKKCHNQL